MDGARGWMGPGRPRSSKRREPQQQREWERTISPCAVRSFDSLSALQDWIVAASFICMMEPGRRRLVLAGEITERDESTNNTQEGSITNEETSTGNKRMNGIVETAVLTSTLQ
jgi:hypothetical protein